MFLYHSLQKLIYLLCGLYVCGTFLLFTGRCYDNCELKRKAELRVPD